MAPTAALAAPCAEGRLLEGLPGFPVKGSALPEAAGLAAGCAKGSVASAAAGSSLPSASSSAARSPGKDQRSKARFGAGRLAFGNWHDIWGSKRLLRRSR